MRRLGQHFLKDESVLIRIAEAIEIKPTDTIVEIGPGHGELTTHIVSASPAKIIVIERDENFVPNLKLLGKKGTTVEVIEGDALEILPDLPKTHNLEEGNYKLVGNIPYYITGKLLRTLGELDKKPSLIILTIQKEVAERLTATPPKMNLLAASVGFWGTPEIIRKIKRGSFYPQPKVESAVVKIIPKKPPKNRAESLAYYALVKALFKQPRKTIANNLKNGLSISKKEVESMLLKHDLDPNLRPQNLSLDTINTLSHNLTPNEL